MDPQLFTLTLPNILETHFPYSLHFFPQSTGNLQQMDEEKKGLWKTLMERLSKSPEDLPEKPTEK